MLIDYLLPGKHLYLLGSGTGLAPFLSIVRDPETYARFEKVIIVHGVRAVAELAYHDYLSHELPQHEFLGEMVSRQLLYYPTVTREPFSNKAASRPCSKPVSCKRTCRCPHSTPPMTA